LEASKKWRKGIEFVALYAALKVIILQGFQKTDACVWDISKAVTCRFASTGFAMTHWSTCREVRPGLQVLPGVVIVDVVRGILGLRFLFKSTARMFDLLLLLLLLLQLLPLTFKLAPLAWMILFCTSSVPTKHSFCPRPSSRILPAACGSMF